MGRMLDAWVVVGLMLEDETRRIARALNDAVGDV